MALNDAQLGPAILRGRAFAARQSRPFDAELRLAGDRAEIVDAMGTVIAGCPRAELRFDAPLGRVPRRATLPDGTLFETTDHAGVDAVVGRSASSLLHTLERFHPRLLVFVALSVGAAWVIWRYALDILAAAAVAVTPMAVVEAIDAGTLKTIDISIAAPSTLSAGEQARAESVFAALLAALDDDARSAHDYRLAFRSMPGVGPNAFALPGGTIVVTDEFIRRFPSDDVRAGVLSHEIGHVTEKHGLHQLYRSLGVAVLIALIAGDTGPIVEDIVLEGNVILSLSFSRAHERAADTFGVRLAERAGYDPVGLIEFFRWLERELGDEGPSWLSTHPATSERSEALRKLIGAE